jgi:hypothetical protein
MDMGNSGAPAVQHIVHSTSGRRAHIPSAFPRHFVLPTPLILARFAFVLSLRIYHLVQEHLRFVYCCLAPEVEVKGGDCTVKKKAMR